MISVCTIFTEGAPSLRFLQGWVAMLHALLFCNDATYVRSGGKPRFLTSLPSPMSGVPRPSRCLRRAGTTSADCCAARRLDSATKSSCRPNSLLGRNTSNSAGSIAPTLAKNARMGHPFSKWYTPAIHQWWATRPCSGDNAGDNAGTDGAGTIVFAQRNEVTSVRMNA